MDGTARRLGLYFVLGGLMAVLDTTVTVVAIPRLVSEFAVGLDAVAWVTTGYALALVSVMPLGAWTVNRFGPREVYLAALATFTLGSLCTGLAWNITSLITFRVIQGLGGGLLGPVSLAIALAAVPESRRGAMMSLQGLPVLIGPLLGPVVGGLLIDQVSWRWIFLLNVPIGLVALALGPKLLPHITPETSLKRLDLTGLILLCPGIALTVFGLSGVGEPGGATQPGSYLPLVLGITMVATFVRRALTHPAPLLRITILRIPAMAAGTVTLGLMAAAYFGSAVIMPAYIQIIRGDSATLTGLVGIPQALATGLMLQLATRLTDRRQPRTIIGVGIATALIGTVARAAVLTADTPYWLIAALGAIIGLGIGATLAPTMTAATRPLTAADLPTGTTVLNLTSQTALATGTALLTAILSWLASINAPALGAHAIEIAAHLNAAQRAVHATALAHATSYTLLASALLMTLALIASRRLPPEHRGGKPLRHDTADTGSPTCGEPRQR
jgi:EmrB/QacA subfamily drug resistance transporter